MGNLVKNHRIAEVGRDHWRPPNPPPCSEEGLPDQAAQGLARQREASSNEPEDTLLLLHFPFLVLLTVPGKGNNGLLQSFSLSVTEASSKDSKRVYTHPTILLQCRHCYPPPDSSINLPSPLVRLSTGRSMTRLTSFCYRCYI